MSWYLWSNNCPINHFTLIMFKLPKEILTICFNFCVLIWIKVSHGLILFIFDLTNVIEKGNEKWLFFSYSGQASGGHYYSFIRNKDSDGEFRWYKFDDGDVTEIKMEDEEELKVSLLLPIIDGAAVLRYFDIFSLLIWNDNDLFFQKLSWILWRFIINY